MALSMFEQIAKNRRNTFVLIAAMSALFVAVGTFVGLVFFSNSVGGLILAGAFAAVMALFSYFSGDSLILAVSGARQIRHEDMPQLFNVVEELAISGGIPMPKVYLIEDEAMNAFATGRDPEHASVAITSGLVQKLNRAELQGVMAHELSHVMNRDILYSMMVGVLAGAIVMLADFALRYMFWFGGGRSRSSSNNNNQGQAILMIVGLALAILAPILATLVQLAVSRQREYLADATAVKLTRYPEGLASALEKLTKDTHELRGSNRATAHLYIVNPFPKVRKAARGAWSTHPPLEERIQRIRQLG
ncbi:MAG TPA: zinc metalloprotease HtpX [Candidatus Bipolaricaulota bacterium]